MDKMAVSEKLDSLFETAKTGEIYRCVIDLTEKALIEKALSRSYGNQLSAARMLGLNRNTLRMKIRKLQIDTAQFKE